MNAPTKITLRRVDELIPYARNARTHSEEQVTRLAASIKEFGFTNPILVDGQNGIIAGHGRLAAAQKLGMDEVPTIELSGFTETQKRAYILADNRLALDSGWDYQMLEVELTDLGDDALLSGFTEGEIEAILDPSGELNPDGFGEGFSYAEKDQFQVAFLFPTVDREVVEEWVKSYGKEKIAAELLMRAKEGVR